MNKKIKEDIQEIKKIVTNEDKIEFIQKQISLIEKKENKIYFWVTDLKGNVSSTLQYLYDIALSYHENGYDVTMLHTEKDKYEGINSWAGDKYDVLKHKCMVEIVFKPEPSDIIFVPEMMLYLLPQLKEIKSKIIVIFQNMNYAMSYRQGMTKWYDLNVFDVITKTNTYKKFINDYLPPIETTVIPPKIDNIFLNTDTTKKPIIAVVSKSEVDFNKIVLPFYWKYPQYSWFTFVELRGLSKVEMAETLKESAIAIWIDDNTDFGYLPLEASKAGCVTLAKVPNSLSDWMVNEEGELNNGVVWFDDYQIAPKILASLIDTWLNDKLSQEMVEDINTLGKLYTSSEFEKNTIEYINKINSGIKERFDNLILRLTEKINKEKK